MRKTDRITFQQRIDELLIYLRNEILSERKRPGELLPTETQLSEQFNLSRKSVRSALRILEEEGNIVKIPNVGNKVLATQKEDVVIRLGYYKSLMREMVLEQLVEQFQTRFPRIQVQLISMPDEEYGETTYHYLRNDMIDLMTINYSDYMLFQEKYGCSPYFHPFEDDEGFYPFLTAPYRSNNQLLVKPLIFSPIILCYNKEHFAEMGIAEPDSGWTWDDVIGKARLLGKGEGRYGFYYHLLSETRWSVFLLQNDVRFRRKGEYSLCRPEFKAAIEFAQNLLYSQSTLPPFLLQSENDAEYLFKQGKASMIMTTYFNLNRLKDCQFAFDIAPLPTNNQFKTLLLNIGVAVSKQSKVKEAAIELANYLAGPEAQAIIREQTFSLPSLKKVSEPANSPLTDRVSRYHVYREIIPTFHYYTAMDIRPIEFNRIRKELRLFWSGLETLEQFCERMETETES